MTQLQEKLTHDQERQLRSIQAQRRRNGDQVVVIPPDAVEEKSFEEKVREWYPAHHDIRKRPR